MRLLINFLMQAVNLKDTTFKSICYTFFKISYVFLVKELVLYKLNATHFIIDIFCLYF